MSMEVIPIPEPDDDDQRIEYAFDQVALLVDLRWNAQLESYMLDILELDETPMIQAIRVVIEQDLLEGHRVQVPTLPAGRLVAFDTSGQKLEAGKGDLGARVKLTYGL